MIKQFTEAFTKAMKLRLEKLYIPKTSKAQMSRIVLFESINASAESDFLLETIVIQHDRIDADGMKFSVVFNDATHIDYEVKITGTKIKEVQHV